MPRRGPEAAVRALLALALLVPLAGCASPDPCHDPPGGRAAVQAMSGSDAHVLLADGQPAVLHLPPAVHVDGGAGCAQAGPGVVRVGDTLAFEVDAWAESYPIQGWPETVVVLRR
jgi:hypothetical protein